MTDTPLRLLVVQPALPRYRLAVYRELARRSGLDVLLWYGDEPAIKNARPEGFRAEMKPIVIRSVLGQQVRWHAAQLEAVSRDDVDVVVLGWSTRYLTLLPALRKARKRGLPIILWGHGYSKRESALRVWLRNRLARQATALLLYDQNTATRLVESGYPQEQVFAAPNAIDLAPIQRAMEPYRSDPSLLADFRSQNDIAGRRVLIFVSRLYEENRVDLLIDAVGRVANTFPEVLAIVIGDGPDRDRLEARIAESGSSERVRMLGAIFDEQQLAPWMLSAEALVYPANIGLSLLHAFGYGLPVVTGDDLTAQNPEIVALKDRHNGCLFRGGDAESLADTLIQLLSDEELRDRLGAAALKTVTKHYNVVNMVDGMERAVRYALRAAQPS